MIKLADGNLSVLAGNCSGFYVSWLSWFPAEQFSCLNAFRNVWTGAFHVGIPTEF